MRKGIVGVSLALALTTGCAMTSSHHSGPNGRPVHWIDGTSASAAYAKASKLCPMGYEILGAPNQVSVVDYVMTIECKAPAARSNWTPPAPASIAQQSAPYPSSTGKTQEQQLDELSRTPGLSYEEYQRRYRVITGQQ